MKPSNRPEEVRSAAPPTGPLRLGGFVLDVAAGELLTADGRLAGLRRQALDLLLVLGRRATQVVAKDELMNLVWPDVVVGEGSLTQAIADIRRVLGDTEHRLVRNIARRGYMLMPDSPADAPALSVAIMPLAIEGATDDVGWFADALHGDLIIEVARLQGSLVIAHGTVATYKNRAVDPRQVARELRVRHVVLGSMRHEGRQIRLKLALVDGETGGQIWAESFVAAREELPASLAELAVRLGRALEPALYRSAAQRRAALSPQEVTADDLAMRAFTLWFQGFNAENVSKARELCEQAVALDPGSVRAWWGLSINSLQSISNRWLADPDAAARRIDDAVAHLDRLAPDSHQAYQARVIQAYLRKDWPATLRLSTAWAERNRHPVAFGTVGIASLLNGRLDSAVSALETALRLSPHDPIRAEWQYRLAMAHFAAARYEPAAEWAATAADTNPSLPWPPIHAAALQKLGRTDEARQALAAFRERHPDFKPAHILERLPSNDPILSDGRERLIAALEEIDRADTGGPSRPRRPRKA